jgi:ABC-type glycerol-3-phosphate transport system permease component
MHGRQAALRSVKWLLVAAFVAVIIFPFYWALSSSFKPAEEILSDRFTMFPRQFTLSNYREVFNKPQAPFGLFFLNSFLVSIVATAITLLTSVSSGYVFSKFRFPLSNVLFATVLATMMMPIQVYVIPLFLTVKNLRLINSIPGMIFPWIIMSTGIFFLRQNIDQIPDELLDAARIDGCSEYAILSRVIFPLSKSAIVAIAIISFNAVWNEFFWPLVVAQDTSVYTVNLGLTYFQRQYTIQYGVNMAAAFLSACPPLAIFLVLRKHILENIALSGLKL